MQLLNFHVSSCLFVITMSLPMAGCKGLGLGLELNLIIKELKFCLLLADEILDI